MSLLCWERPDQAQRSPGPSGPGTPKESEKSPKGCPAPGSPRVPKECATESEKSPKRVRSCVFGLFSDFVVHSLGTLGLPGAGHPFGLFSDSFGVPGPKGPGDLCAWSGRSQLLWVMFSRTYLPSDGCSNWSSGTGYLSLHFDWFSVYTLLFRVFLLRKEPEVKTQRAKTSQNFAEDKLFADDISEDFSEDRRYHLYWILVYFWISSKSSRKIAFFGEIFGSSYPLSFYP